MIHQEVEQDVYTDIIKRNINMRYFNEYVSKPFTGKELKKASELQKKEFPEGPRVTTVKPDKEYSFNEISSNIRPTLYEISRSLHEIK
jgi:hypothetical protein